MKHKHVVIFFFAVLMAAGCSTAGHHRLDPFERDGKWGYRDENKKIVIQPRYMIARDFLPEGIAAVADATSWAYINKKGKVVMRPFMVDNGPDDFREGLARYPAAGKLGFFDKSGRIVIAARFDFVWPFHEGLAAFCVGCRRVPCGEHTQIKGGAWGFVDASAKTVIRPRFDAARSFSEGLAAVRVKKRWGYIDKSGGFAIEPRFDRATDFTNQRARVAIDGQWFQIDAYGARISGRGKGRQPHER